MSERDAVSEHICLPPFAATSGPRDARTVICGEAWGETEERLRVPFAGASGRLLFQLLLETWGGDHAPLLAAALAETDGARWLALREEWLHAESILLTNVLALRPPSNNLAFVCCKKDELDASSPGRELPPLRTENPRFLRAMYLPELRRLGDEIAASPRNLFLALGNTPTWAALGSAAIGTLRGAVAEGGGASSLWNRLESGRAGEVEHMHRVDRVLQRQGHTSADGRGGPGATESEPERRAAASLKILPTYHPAAIFHRWEWRAVLAADLLKANRERQFAEVRRRRRRILTSPTIAEVEAWTREALASARLLAPDIETMNGQIRCIGFARAIDDVLVVPFIADLSGRSYWSTLDEECRAWACVRALLESEIPKLGQNFLFDLQYITRMGIRPRRCLHDTMLLHHVMFPELQKGLGFLASVYCNESAYKLLRKHGEELKRDE